MENELEKELEKAREVFLTSVDEDVYASNLEDVQQWEKEIAKHQAFRDWQQHDVSKMLISRVKSEYRSCTEMLAFGRHTEDQRLKLWSKQDACLFLLSVISADPVRELELLRAEIRSKIDATNAT